MGLTLLKLKLGTAFAGAFILALILGAGEGLGLVLACAIGECVVQLGILAGEKLRKEVSRGK